MEDGINNVTFLKRSHYFSLKWFDYFAAHALIPPIPSPSFLFLFCSYSLKWFEILAKWRSSQPSFTLWKLKTC